LFAADGIILASPVYFKHVTAQLKTFLDRSLTFGHKPRVASKPGLAVIVSAGLADTSTAHYLEGMLRIYGAFSLGALVAIGTSPGGFLGKEAVEDRAQDLARDLVRAIKEKKRYPVTGDDLFAYLFMRDLVTREKDFMRDDYQYWQKAGFLEGSHEKPDVLIKAPAEVWLAISQGVLDGQSAFMSGKYRAEGNVGLLLKLKPCFRFDHFF